MTSMGTIVILMAMSVQLFLAVYHAILALRVPSKPECRCFAEIATALAVANVGWAIAASASTGAQACLGHSIGFAAGALTFDACARFTHTLSPVEPPMVISTIRCWTISGVTLAVAGLFCDPSGAIYPVEPGDGIVGVFTPTLIVHSTMTALISMVLVVRALRHGTNAPLLRVVLATYIPVHGLWYLMPIVPMTSPLFLAVIAVTSTVATLSLALVLIQRFSVDEKALAKHRTRLKAETAKLAQERRSLRDDEHFATVGSLAGLIAHQVRNPLSVLQNASSGLRKSSTSPENRAALVRILDEETDHLDRLVNDLLSYALPLRPQVETVNIKQLAKASAADHLSGSPHLNIECEFDTEAGPDTIDGDRELLKQALDQLLMNAADAMPSGGTVRIRTTATELDGAQAIGLSVIDTGPGMGDAIKSQALDPFFTTRATSSGLGLAIVQKVAQSHEGALTMSSEEGHGTTVTLTLRTAWPAPDAGSDIDTSPPLNLSP